MTTLKAGAPFFIHVHVPKTGGTTISSVLRKNFGEKYDPFEGRWIHHYPHLTSAQIKAYAEKHVGILATSSHNFTLDLPLVDCKRPVYAFACVRNPVDRFFSFYFHMRHRYGVKHPSKDLYLKDYINLSVGQLGKGEYLKSQFPNLTCDGNIISTLEEHITAGRFFLIPTERMELGLSLIQRKFPQYFKDISFEKLNISKKDQEITEDMREAVAEKISPDDWILDDFANKCVEGGRA